MIARDPFKPKADLPEWRLIYDSLMAQADFGDVITYDQLNDVLGRPLVDDRSPLYRARRELGDMRHRWVEPVKGVGYRVIEANEHLQAAQSRKRRARRQLGMMVKIANVTDLTRLTPDELVKFDSQAKVNAVLYMVAMHHEQRISRIEGILRGEGRLPA